MVPVLNVANKILKVIVVEFDWKLDFGTENRQSRIYVYYTVVASKK
jgi:hypothetical protein